MTREIDNASGNVLGNGVNSRKSFPSKSSVDGVNHAYRERFVLRYQGGEPKAWVSD
jgi:hypothetical protein